MKKLMLIFVMILLISGISYAEELISESEKTYSKGDLNYPIEFARSEELVNTMSVYAIEGQEVEGQLIETVELELYDENGIPLLFSIAGEITGAETICCKRATGQIQKATRSKCLEFLARLGGAKELPMSECDKQQVKLKTITKIANAIKGTVTVKEKTTRLNQNELKNKDLRTSGLCSRTDKPYCEDNKVITCSSNKKSVRQCRTDEKCVDGRSLCTKISTKEITKKVEEKLTSEQVGGKVCCYNLFRGFTGEPYFITNSEAECTSSSANSRISSINNCLKPETKTLKEQKRFNMKCRAGKSKCPININYGINADCSYITEKDSVGQPKACVGPDGKCYRNNEMTFINGIKHKCSANSEGYWEEVIEAITPTITTGCSQDNGKCGTKGGYTNLVCCSGFICDDSLDIGYNTGRCKTTEIIAEEKPTEECKKSIVSSNYVYTTDQKYFHLCNSGTECCSLICQSAKLPGDWINHGYCMEKITEEDITIIEQTCERYEGKICPDNTYCIGTEIADLQCCIGECKEATPSGLGEGEGETGAGGCSQGTEPCDDGLCREDCSADGPSCKPSITDSDITTLIPGDKKDYLCLDEQGQEEIKSSEDCCSGVCKNLALTAGTFFQSDKLAHPYCYSSGEKGIGDKKVGGEKVLSSSMTFGEWQEASAGARLKSLCVDNEDCNPYEDLYGTGKEYDVACKSTGSIQGILQTDVENICKDKKSAGNYYAIGGGSVGLVGGCAIGASLLALGGPTAIPGCIIGAIAGTTIGATAGKSAGTTLYIDCKNSKLPSDMGACIAIPEGQEGLMGFDWCETASGFNFLNMKDKCQGGTITIIGGIFLIFLLFSMLRR